MSVQRVIANVNRRADQRVRALAERLGEIAEETHQFAPRGGTNINRFGLPRSAPGEPPATETDTLLGLIERPAVRLAEAAYEVIVNYDVLETGTEHLAPRPLGRISLERLRAEIRSGIL